MATVNIAYSSVSTLTVAALQSLADDAYWESDVIDNSSTKAIGANIMITIQTTTTAGDAAGLVPVYYVGSNDNTDFSGHADSASQQAYAVAAGEEDALTSVGVKHMRFLGTMVIDANSTTAMVFNKDFKIPMWTLDQYWKLVLGPQTTGTALGATANKITVVTLTATSA